MIVFTIEIIACCFILQYLLLILVVIANILDSCVLVLLVWTLNLPSWSSLLTLHIIIFTKVIHFKWIQFKMTDDQIVDVTNQDIEC